MTFFRVVQINVRDSCETLNYKENLQHQLALNYASADQNYHTGLNKAMGGNPVSGLCL